MAPRLKTTRGSAIGRIAARAEQIGLYGIPAKTIAMMVKTYHERIAPLRITDMAHGSDANLAHDLGGIIDDVTGHPRPHWTPRYARDV
jgi:hypothetical protein